MVKNKTRQEKNTRLEIPGHPYTPGHSILFYIQAQNQLLAPNTMNFSTKLNKWIYGIFWYRQIAIKKLCPVYMIKGCHMWLRDENFVRFACTCPERLQNRKKLHRRRGRRRTRWLDADSPQAWSPYAISDRWLQHRRSRAVAREELLLSLYSNPYTVRKLLVMAR